MNKLIKFYFYCFGQNFIRYSTGKEKLIGIFDKDECQMCTSKDILMEKGEFISHNKRIYRILQMIEYQKSNNYRLKDWGSLSDYEQTN